MNKKKKEKINKEGVMENMRICDYCPIYHILFLHFSFMTSQKTLDPEYIIIGGHYSQGFPILSSSPKNIIGL